jgi:NAD(P)-dependent dehydrogenase (short-subunit alcohol dehydrogenase family)
MNSFDDKVAAITGAGSGMGASLALELARRGCQLALCDIDEAALEVSAAKARLLGVKVTTTVVDVAERAAVHDWAETVVREHGRVHLVFNNAGVAVGGTAEDTDYRDIDWIVGINLWGVVHGTKAFLPHLAASGEGHVVNTSSVFGLVGVPGQSAYNATKFAVRGYTEALRAELKAMGSCVSATCVHPGGIRTAIARHARTDASVARLGVDPAKAASDFERHLRTTPDRAAQLILKAVAQDRARVLIGADAHLLDLLGRLLPGGYHTPLRRLLGRKQG